MLGGDHSPERVNHIHVHVFLQNVREDISGRADTDLTDIYPPPPPPHTHKVTRACTEKPGGGGVLHTLPPGSVTAHTRTQDHNYFNDFIMISTDADAIPYQRRI